MANVLVAQQSAAPAGTVVTDGTPSASDFYYWPNNGKDLLIVKNGSGSSINVTINRYGTFDGDTVADRVVAVAAGAEKVIGPFDMGIYNAPSGGLEGNAIFAFSAGTSVTYKIIRPTA